MTKEVHAIDIMKDMPNRACSQQPILQENKAVTGVDDTDQG